MYQTADSGKPVSEIRTSKRKLTWRWTACSFCRQMSLGLTEELELYTLRRRYYRKGL